MYCSEHTLKEPPAGLSLRVCTCCSWVCACVSLLERSPSAAYKLAALTFWDGPECSQCLPVLLRTLESKCSARESLQTSNESITCTASPRLLAYGIPYCFDSKTECRTDRRRGTDRAAEQLRPNRSAWPGFLTLTPANRRKSGLLDGMIA